MTLLEQGHLCPLPLTVQPVYWDFDYALRLYPLPTVVILADDCDEYNWVYENCAVFNPGSFHRDSGFIVYRPGMQKTEICRIRDASL
jgi:DNA polymerase epsilon subunit 2